MPSMKNCLHRRHHCNELLSGVRNWLKPTGSECNVFQFENSRMVYWYMNIWKNPMQEELLYNFYLHVSWVSISSDSGVNCNYINLYTYIAIAIGQAPPYSPQKSNIKTKSWSEPRNTLSKIVDTFASEMERYFVVWHDATFSWTRMILFNYLSFCSVFLRMGALVLERVKFPECASNYLWTLWIDWFFNSPWYDFEIS